MGIFDSVFGKRKDNAQKKEQIPWKPLESLEQLDEIVKKSSERTQIIFKHSTTCGISSMVLRMFSSSNSFGNVADFHFLDIHANRKVSHAVESRFDIVHQSPQLLIIKGGQVSFHTSHGGIADINLQEYL